MNAAVYDKETGVILRFGQYTPNAVQAQVQNAREAVREIAVQLDPLRAYRFEADGSITETGLSAWGRIMEARDCNACDPRTT